MPHAVLQNTNVSTPSTPLSEGSGVGKHTELSVQHQQQQLHQQQLLTIDKNAIIAHNQVVGTELLKISRQEPARVAFVLELTATRDWRWEGILWRSRLYLEVPQRLAQTGSKEGFLRCSSSPRKNFSAITSFSHWEKIVPTGMMWSAPSCFLASASCHLDTSLFRPTRTTSSSCSLE